MKERFLLPDGSIVSRYRCIPPEGSDVFHPTRRTTVTVPRDAHYDWMSEFLQIVQYPQDRFMALIKPPTCRKADVVQLDSLVTFLATKPLRKAEQHALADLVFEFVDTATLRMVSRHWAFSAALRDLHARPLGVPPAMPTAKQGLSYGACAAVRLYMCSEGATERGVRYLMSYALANADAQTTTTFVSAVVRRFGHMVEEVWGILERHARVHVLAPYAALTAGRTRMFTREEKAFVRRKARAGQVLACCYSAQTVTRGRKRMRRPSLFAACDDEATGLEDVHACYIRTNAGDAGALFEGAYDNCLRHPIVSAPTRRVTVAPDKWTRTPHIPLAGRVELQILKSRARLAFNNMSPRRLSKYKSTLGARPARTQK